MMTTPHKAMPESWEDVKAFVINTRASLLQLRNRVAALEATQHTHIDSSFDLFKAASPPPAPDHVRGAPEMVATDGAYNLGRQHGAAQATCPHVRTSDEGTSYCALAEKTASQPRQEEEAAPSPAPAGGLVERMRSALGMREFLSDAELSSMIHVVADWLQLHSGIIANGSQWAEMLRKEADR